MYHHFDVNVIFQSLDVDNDSSKWRPESGSCCYDSPLRILRSPGSHLGEGQGIQLSLRWRQGGGGYGSLQVIAPSIYQL